MIENSVPLEVIMYENEKRYAGKISDPTDFKKESEPLLYYEECLQASLSDIQTTNIMKRYLDATTLRYDLISIGQNMLNEITYNGCKEIVIVSSKAMRLSYGTPYEEEILNAIIYQTVTKILDMDLEYISGVAKITYMTSYKSEDFFNSLDLLLNLYYAFGLKLFLTYAIKVFDFVPYEILAEELKPRFENYHLYINKLLNEPWHSPATNIKIAINDTKQQSSHNKSEGCYIATSVYGSYESPQVLILRQFRDIYLENKSWGRKFISYYYKYSPTYADKLKNTRIINLVVRKILDLLIFIIKKGG